MALCSSFFSYEIGLILQSCVMCINYFLLFFTGEFVQEKVNTPSFWTSLMKCMLMILSTEKMSDKVTKEERERKFFDFFNCHFRPPHGFINESDSEHGFA